MTLTSSDALAGAETRGAELLTTDARLGRAAYALVDVGATVVLRGYRPLN